MSHIADTGLFIDLFFTVLVVFNSLIKKEKYCIDEAVAIVCHTGRSNVASQ